MLTVSGEGQKKGRSLSQSHMLWKEERKALEFRAIGICLFF